MKAIITHYDSEFFPIRIDWDNGKKSIVTDCEIHALNYIESFLPIDTEIINRLPKAYRQIERS